jgi:predicted TIM-barrel fold metal-dependent hydrolase
MDTIYSKRRWLMGATCQFHCQLSIHVQALVQGGVFDRFPGAQIIVGHLGENLVFPLTYYADLANAYLASRSTCQELGKDDGISHEEDLRSLFP